MSHVRQQAVALGCAVAVTVVGCGGSNGAEAPATTVPPVPAIDDAKDVRGVDPCAVFAPEQLGQAGFGAPGVPGRTPESLPLCEWQGTNGAVLTITLLLAPDALGTLAQNSDPTTARVRLAGYPALETFTEEGRYCRYDVGPAPDQVLIGAMSGGVPDSCTALQGMMITALPNLPPHQS